MEILKHSFSLSKIELKIYSNMLYQCSKFKASIEVTQSVAERRKLRRK